MHALRRWCWEAHRADVGRRLLLLHLLAVLFPCFELRDCLHAACTALRCATLLLRHLGCGLVLQVNQLRPPTCSPAGNRRCDMAHHSSSQGDAKHGSNLLADPRRITAPWTEQATGVTKRSSPVAIVPPAVAATAHR